MHFDFSICLLFESPITSLNDLLQQEPDRIKLSIFHFSPLKLIVFFYLSTILVYYLFCVGAEKLGYNEPGYSELRNIVN